MKRENLFKGRVLRSLGIPEDSPGKLERARKFNQGLKLSEEYDKSKLLGVLDLSGYKQEQKQKDVEILLANLINARGWLTVPMGADYWHQPQYNAASPFTTELIKQLDDLKLIDMKIGYQSAKISRYTRIKGTDQLREYCPLLPDQVIYEPVNLVEVRDWNGRLLPYTDTARTSVVKDKLRLVNAVNEASEILIGTEVYKAFMVAISLVSG